MRAIWPVAVMVLSMSGAAARAETLACSVFKDRLNGALLAAGAKDATAFRSGFTDATGHSRSDWGDDSIGGALRCGPADEFEEFDLSLQFKTKESFADDINRFLTMQGASLCTLTSDGVGPCKEFARTMLQEALQQMGLKASRGAKAPSALVDRTLFANATAELTSAPSLVTFVLGPGRGGTVEASRPALPPVISKPPE